MERNEDSMAQSIDEISEILKSLKFKKKFVGGVDEEDVWRIIGKLQGEYEELRSIDEAKKNAVIEDRDKEITDLKKRIYMMKKASKA